MTLFLFTKIVFGNTTFFGSYEFLSPNYGVKNPACLRDSCVFSYPCNSNFTCGGIKLNIKKGTYLLEVWGAQGGYSSPKEGLYGGYSYALVDFPKDQTIYLYIGGIGDLYTGVDRLTNKAFNGGGSGCYYGGGGATDFRVDNYLSSRFLIAGGSAYSYYSSEDHFDSGGGVKSTYVSDKYFGNGYSYSTFSQCHGDGYYYSGGGGGLYGVYDRGGSGFVYPIRRPPSIREITELTVIEGETFSGLNSYIEGRAKISLYYNDNSNNPVNHKTCPFYESFGSRRRR